MRGIAVHGHHGVFEVERREGQEFVIDLVLGMDTGAAAPSDDLQDTVDYGTLVDEVRSAVANDPVDLIETLAQRIADVCLRHDQVDSRGSDRAQAARPDPGDVRGRRPDHQPEPSVTRERPAPAPRPTTTGAPVTESPNPTSSTPTRSPARCTPSAAR